MGKIKQVHMAYQATIPATVKRAVTIHARKTDTGCTCHGLDLVKCPDYQPVIWADYRHRSGSTRVEVS